MGEVTEVRQLRREVRELRLAVEAVGRSVDSDARRRRSRVGDYKWYAETPLVKCGIGTRAHQAIGHLLGDPLQDIFTLEDLTYLTRDEVTQIKGVGRATAKRLDDAMAERGLTWGAA